MTPSDLIQWRTARGLSQAQAATLLGVHRQSLTNYEKGKRPIPDDVAARARGELETPTPQIQDIPKPPPRARKPAQAAVTYPADMPEPDGPVWVRDFPLADPPYTQTVRWRRVVDEEDGTTRLVNPFIPRPVGRKLDCWRFVLTESGDAYDFETGARVSGAYLKKARAA